MKTQERLWVKVENSCPIPSAQVQKPHKLRNYSEAVKKTSFIITFYILFLVIQVLLLVYIWSQASCWWWKKYRVPAEYVWKFLFWYFHSGEASNFYYILRCGCVTSTSTILFFIDEVCIWHLLNSSTSILTRVCMCVFTPKCRQRITVSELDVQDQLLNVSWGCVLSSALPWCGGNFVISCQPVFFSYYAVLIYSRHEWARI